MVFGRCLGRVWVKNTCWCAGAATGVGYAPMGRTLRPSPFAISKFTSVYAHITPNLTPKGPFVGSRTLRPPYAHLTPIQVLTGVTYAHIGRNLRPSLKSVFLIWFLIRNLLSLGQIELPSGSFLVSWVIVLRPNTCLSPEFNSKVHRSQMRT